MHPDETAPLVHTRADLIAGGLGPRQITAAVREGRLLRVRRDRYMYFRDDAVEAAVRVGGRLACVSLLAMLGVFVMDTGALHIHLDRSMSRLRSPLDATRPLSDAERSGLKLHWSPLGERPSHAFVDIRDALAQAIRCQPVRCAVATLDSAMHRGLIAPHDLAELSGRLPARYRVVVTLADGSAESGPETFMRLLLRQLGLRYRTQVWIAGVGRVDFLVEDSLIIECDSRAHHEGWVKQRDDRRRDLAAAAMGYATLRPLAEHLFFEPEVVRTAVLGLIRARR